MGIMQTGKETNRWETFGLSGGWPIVLGVYLVYAHSPYPRTKTRSCLERKWKGMKQTGMIFHGMLNS